MSPTGEKAKGWTQFRCMHVLYREGFILLTVFQEFQKGLVTVEVVFNVCQI